MNAMLKDLVAHAEWADAVAYHALSKCPAALADADVLERLDHTAGVATAFSQMLKGEMPGGPPPDRLPFEGIRAKALAAHRALAAWIDGATKSDLDHVIHVPWFPDPPCRIPAREALLQAVLHTQHHRGQTMTRLKQLGGKAANVDFIIWLWKGRPAPRWPD